MDGGRFLDFKAVIMMRHKGKKPSTCTHQLLEKSQNQPDDVFYNNFNIN